jgi:hypothetical protein
MQLIKPLVFLTAVMAAAFRLAAQPASAADSSSGSGWLLLLPIAVIAAGGILIRMSVTIGRKAKASLQWTSVPGTIVVSEMVEDKVGENASSQPLITYSYVVNAQAFRSSRVGFVSSKSSKVVAKYPRGNPVEVFFDPQAPSSAVLEKGGSTRFMVFLGVALIVGGLIGVLVMS